MSAAEPSLPGLGLEFPVANDEQPTLPGPAFALPVDLDGDGLVTFGDQFVFNWWLASGGDLASALLSGYQKEKGSVIDLSEFFSSIKAALTPDAAIGTSAIEGDSEGVFGAAAAAATAGKIDFTRRIPTIPVPTTISKHARMTADGRFFVLSTKANLDGSGVNTKYQVFIVEANSQDAARVALISKNIFGQKADQDCLYPSISDDGTKVVFETTAELDPIRDIAAKLISCCL